MDHKQPQAELDATFYVKISLHSVHLPDSDE